MSQTSVPPIHATQPPSRNARATVRYHCAPAMLGKVYVSDDHEFQHACLSDLSLTGVGLSVPREIPAGTEAVLHLRGNDGVTTFDLPVRVVHSTETPQRDWVAGCEFVTPLTPEDLDNLL